MMEFDMMRPKIGDPTINTYATSELDMLTVERWKNGHVIIHMGPKDSIEFTREEWEIFCRKFLQIRAHMQM